MPAPARHDPPGAPDLTGELPAGRPGTLMVVGVRRQHDIWVLVVKAQDGGLSDFAVEAAPDAAALRRELPEGSQPLALRFQAALRADEPVSSCTCLVTSREGPTRIQLSMSAALALVAAGRHAIVATPLSGG